MQWSSIIIPRTDREELQMRILFQQSALSSLLRSLDAILIDSRRKMYRDRFIIAHNVSYTWYLPEAEDFAFMKTKQ